MPILARPELGKRLWVYFAALKGVVSSVMIQHEGPMLKAIYFVSQLLKDAECRYYELEKWTLVLVITAQRMHLYFFSYPITVLTNNAIRRVLTRLEVSGRLTNWIIELSEYDIQYHPRTSIKV